MIPSKRQQDILDIWNTEDSNILISAVPGSGKTSTLLLILEACKYKTLFLAFNKSIQTEIEEKMSKKGLTQGKAMTMHAMGLAAIRASGKRFNINNNKNWSLIKEVQQICKKEYKSTASEDKMRLNYSLIDMNDVSRMFLTDDIKEIRSFMKTIDKTLFDSPHLEQLWEIFVELRNKSYEQKVMEIDFNDMIYLPVIKNLAIPIHPYYVCMDEIQDWNLCQHRLIDILLNQGAVRKWVAVGDKNQAIYGFTGASAKSFDLFLDKSNDTKEMPLDVCYRCAKDIIKSANEVYDTMEGFKTNDGVVSLETNFNNIKPNSMVICRNTTPLFELYFDLLSQGKASYIFGNDLMNYLLKFLKPYYSNTIHAADIEMQYKIEELKKDKSEDGKFKLYIFAENYSNFKSIARICNPTDSVEFLSTKLKDLFDDKENAIMLCTIHKSKGLEADVVYILNEYLIPSKFAKSPEQIKQEQNLKYVARTRAKEELYFLNTAKTEDFVLIEDV